MNCDRYRQLLSRYVDGEVTPRQRRDLLHHVEHCSGCAAWLARLRQTDVLLKGSLDEPRPSDHVRAAILKSVRQDGEPGSKFQVPSSKFKAQSAIRNPQSKIGWGMSGLLLRFEFPARRVAATAVAGVVALTSLAYWTGVLPPLEGYQALGFQDERGDARSTPLESQPLEAVSSGYKGIGGTLAVPNLLRYLPAESAQGVGSHDAVRVRFDLPMDRTSTERSFRIDPPAAGAFEWDADNELRFSPQGLGLLRGVTYTVTLSNSARSLAGVPVQTPITWSFRTREAHSVISSMPNGATVAPTDTFMLLFDAPMDRASVAEHLSLQVAESGEVVPATLTWGEAGQTLFVAPAAPMLAGKMYLRVDALARTQAGETLGRSFQFAYDVGLPAARLRLLDGRLHAAAHKGYVPVRYEVLAGDSDAPPEVGFSLYRVPLERLSELLAQSQSRPWPSGLPSSLPEGLERIETLHAVYSRYGEGEGKAELSGFPPGVYLLVATALAKDGALTDWQVLIAADCGLTVVNRSGAGGMTFWTTDEEGHAWTNAEVALYAQDSALQETGITDDNGLWIASKGDGAALAVAYDSAGRLAVVALNATTNGIEPEIEKPKSKIRNLQTDLAEYRPGQAVHFRVLIGQSAEEGREEQEATVSLLTPEGVAVSALTLKPDGVGGYVGLFELSPDLKPGTYTLRVRAGDAERDFPLLVREASRDTLSVYIVHNPVISEKGDELTALVSVLGPTGELHPDTVVTATLGIEGDVWRGRSVTAIVDRDGRAEVSVPLPAWVAEHGDAGLYLKVEAGGGDLQGSDIYYLDLAQQCGVESVECGLEQLTSPSLDLAVTARRAPDGMISIRMVSLGALSAVGDVLVIAYAPDGERIAWALDVASEGDVTLTLPGGFAGGRVRLFRDGASGSRELKLAPVSSGGLSLRIGSPQTAVANAPLSLQLELLNEQEQRVDGVASVWLRRVARGARTGGGSSQAWDPGITLTATGVTTSTLQAPVAPGLWYVLAEAATADGGYAQSWSVVRVLPAPTLQTAPLQSVTSGQAFPVAVIVHNPTGEPFSGEVRAVAGAGQSILGSASQTVRVAAGGWQRVAFSFVADQPGTSSLGFAFASEGATWALSVQARENPRTRTTYTAGVLTGEHTVGVQVPSGLTEDAVHLQVRVSTSLLSALASMAADMGEATKADEGVAMAAARLSAGYSVASAYRSRPSPAGLGLSGVERSLVLQQLYSSQRADGGWGARLDGSGPSSLVDTANVLLAMRRYELAWASAGSPPQPALDRGAINTGLAYLSSEVTRPVGEEPTTALLDERAYGLYVLSLYGALHAEQARPFMAHATSGEAADGLSWEGQAWLALALAAGNPEDALALIERLMLSQAHGQASAPVLEALVFASQVGESRAGAQRASAYELAAGQEMRALMSARRGAGWGSPAATANALWALSRYAAVAEERPVRGAPELTLNNRSVHASIKPDDPGTVSVALDGSVLQAGTNWLKLRAPATGQMLYYSLTLQATR